MPDVEDTTFEAFARWLYGATLQPPTDDRELKEPIQLLCFARFICLEELNNHCVDLIRQYYLDKNVGDPAEHPMVRATDLDLVYYLPVGIKLRFCLCLEAALLACLMQSLHEGHTEDFAELVQNGGLLAVHFACLAVFINKSLPFSLGDSLEPVYDCVFHDHHDTKPCSTEYSSRQREKAEAMQDALESLAYE